jgi:hypothetical protein
MQFLVISSFHTGGFVLGSCLITTIDGEDLRRIKLLSDFTQDAAQKEPALTSIKFNWPKEFTLIEKSDESESLYEELIGDPMYKEFGLLDNNPFSENFIFADDLQCNIIVAPSKEDNDPMFWWQVYLEELVFETFAPSTKEELEKSGL